MRNSNAAAARLATVVIVFGLSQLAHAQPANPAWIQLHPTGGPPGARLVPAAAYDPATNSMIVFGGEAQLSATSNNYNDVWVLANADGLGGTPAWTQLAPFGLAPIPRFGAGAAYDPGSNRLIVFGGAYVDYPAISGACTSFVNGGTANDVWVLTNANGSGGAPSWTPLVPAGVPPAPRRTSVVVYDAANNRLIVFGGSEACGKRNDVWVLSNANGLGGTPGWTQLTPSGAGALPRAGHTAVYHQATRRSVIFGGVACVPCAGLNNTWVLADVVPFAAFSAAAQIHPASSGFTVQGTFTPGSSGSIDPLTQDVTLQLGGFSATIPAGSFAAVSGSFTFTGAINGVPMDATIQPQAGGYGFTFDGAGAPSLPTVNPVTVGLGIGNNGGTIQVTATFN